MPKPFDATIKALAALGPPGFLATFDAPPTEPVPLAPLGRLPANMTHMEALTAVLHRVVERIQREAPAEEIQRLLTATWVLTGLRVDLAEARRLFEGVRGMHESVTYQAILDEGATKKLREVLLRQGRKKFGEPDETRRQALLAIADLEQLDRLSERLFEATTWDEWLQIP